METVEVLAIQADPTSAGTVILLGVPDAPTRVLPIVVGTAEARAIALGLAGIEAPRPSTHDLIGAVITACDAQLERVAVTELVGGTFIAELEVLTPAGLRHVSARPSDAIALAIRLGAPVLVADAVLNEAAVQVEHAADEPFEEQEIEAIVAEFQDALSTVTVADFAAEQPDAHEEPEVPEEPDGPAPPNGDTDPDDE